VRQDRISKYRGVSWYKSRKKWQARIQYDGKQRHIGHFEDEEQAARAYDKAARAHKGEKARLNFPTKKEHAVEGVNFPAVGVSGPRQSSKYRGVYWNKLGKKWKVTIRYGGKKNHLGSFKDEEEAARAYDRAARTNQGERAQLNFHMENESGPVILTKKPRSQLDQDRICLFSNQVGVSSSSDTALTTSVCIL
jgi:hypothetical protein